MSKIVNFSVVIPVYNVGEVLRKCLDSLLNQPFNDYEIILVNDGSTDCKTIEICEEYGKSKSIIRLFNKPNGGCIDARRYGTLQSKGKYITYGDGDYFFAEDYIQILHDAVRHPADLYIFNNFLNYIGKEEFYREKSLPKSGYVDLDWVFEEFLSVRMNAVWDKIYRRALFGEKVDIIPENIIFGDDTYLNNMYLSKIKTVYVYDAAIYYHYIDSKSSVCSSEVTFKNLEDISVVFDSLSVLKELPYFTKKREEAFKDFHYGYYTRAIIALSQKGLCKSEINSQIMNKNIMNNIQPFKASSFRGAIYRLILKYGWYKFATLIS